MGILKDFERSLEGAVEGFFGRMFRSRLQPVELARALQRYGEDNGFTDADGTVVQNLYRFTIGTRDHERLAPLQESLERELAEVVRRTAAERRWRLPGPVVVEIAHDDAIRVGMFELVGRVEAAPAVTPARDHLPPHARPQPGVDGGAGAVNGTVRADVPAHAPPDGAAGDAADAPPGDAPPGDAPLAHAPSADPATSAPAGRSRAEVDRDADTGPVPTGAPDLPPPPPWAPVPPAELPREPPPFVVPDPGSERPLAGLPPPPVVARAVPAVAPPPPPRDPDAGVAAEHGNDRDAAAAPIPEPEQVAEPEQGADPEQEQRAHTRVDLDAGAPLFTPRAEPEPAVAPDPGESGHAAAPASEPARAPREPRARRPLELPSLVGPRSRLTVTNGTHEGATVELSGGRLVAGRHRDCDLRLDDPTVSREHATFVRRGATWWVLDMGSTNGTAVNGTTAGERALSDGDEIAIGDVLLTFTEA